MAMAKLRISSLGIAAVALCAQACTLDTGSEAEVEVESVGETASAWTAPCPSYDTAKYDSCFDSFDTNGFVQTRIYKCKPSPAGVSPAGVCQVENSFALIGGGAAVNSTGAGGLLTDLIPASGGIWLAASQSQFYPDVHTVTAYAIGLRLWGYPAASLKSAIKITEKKSAVAGYNQAVAVIPGDHVLLGGGASVNGQLLTSSFPVGSTAWAATSKQHILPSSEALTAYALSVPRCPPNLGWCLATAISGAVVGGAGTGPRSALVQMPANYAYTAAGAISSGHNGELNSGRMLTAILPVGAGNGITVAWGKDHGFTDSGVTAAYYVGVRREP